MNLKKSLLVVFLFVVSFARSQDYKDNIELEFKNYLKTIEEKDFEKSVSYLPAEFFEIIPRSQMIKMMTSIYDNPSIDFEIINPQILKVDDFEKIDGQFYSLLKYSNQMNIKILNDQEESEDERTMRINLTTLSLENDFGLENVKYVKETDSYEILSTKNVYSISQNGLADWKFLVLEKDQKILIRKLLPKKLIDQLSFESSNN